MRYAAILFALLSALACDRRQEAWVPLDAEPPAPERPVAVPGLGAPVPRAPFDASAAPPAAPSGVRTGATGVAGVTGVAGEEAAEPIRGVLRLGPSESVPNGAILFLIARTEAAGPPLAVKRFAANTFPLAFEIGPADVMIKGRPFVGPIQLSARIDVDGDPLTRDPAPTAALDAAVEPGARGIELVLRSP